MALAALGKVYNVTDFSDNNLSNIIIRFPQVVEQGRTASLRE